MTRRRWYRLPMAVLLALLVNGSGLYLMVQVNRFVNAPNKKTDAGHGTIQLQEPPKRKHRRQVRRQVVKLRPKSVPMAIPDLPSTISSGQLNLAGVGGVDLLDDLMGQAQGLDAELILKEEAVDEPPRIVSRVAPLYPPSAEDRGLEGYVVFKLQVSSLGVVEKAWVVASRPAGVFEVAAERAVRKYRFSPARFRGQAVAVLCRQKIVFRLED